MAYNIGIATGAISGIVVLDLDSADAGAVAEERGLPVTVEAITPRGRHIYFQHPGYPVANIAGRDGGRLPRDLDVRGDGGFVVGHGSYFEPSDAERSEGKVAGAYRWREGRSPADVALAPMPQWVVNAYADQTKSAPAISTAISSSPMATLQARLARSSGRDEAYGAAALERECEELRSAVPGTRNDQLNRSAFAVAQLVSGGAINEHHARAELESAARQAGLQSSEIRATIASAWTAGESSPRSAPANDHDKLSAIPGIPLSPPRSAEQQPGPVIKLRSAADASRSTPPPREYLLEEWLPVGATTCLFGDGGTGKSLAAMMFATAVGAGVDLWGKRTVKAPTLAFYCEDDDHEIERRQQAINSALGLAPEDVADCYFESRFGQSTLLGHIDKSGAFIANELFEEIRKATLETGARLVILDNINMVFGDNINDPGVVTRFMASLNGLALEIKGSVLLLGHIAKSEGSKFAGTMAWSNASRNRLFLGRPDNLSEAARNPDLRHLSRDKSNYARSGENLSLIWDKGALLRPEDISPANALLTNDEVRDNRMFLDLLDELTRKETPLSINRQATNYAPRIMAKDGRYSAGDTKGRMVKAMARLLQSGIIIEDGPLGFAKSNRHPARGIKRVEKPPIAVESAVSASDGVTAAHRSSTNRPEINDLFASLRRGARG